MNAKMKRKFDKIIEDYQAGLSVKEDLENLTAEERQAYGEYLATLTEEAWIRSEELKQIVYKSKN